MRNGQSIWIGIIRLLDLMIFKTKQNSRSRSWGKRGKPFRIQLDPDWLLSQAWGSGFSECGEPLVLHSFHNLGKESLVEAGGVVSRFPPFFCGFSGVFRSRFVGWFAEEQPLRVTSTHQKAPT